MRWVLILVTFVAADVCAASRPGRDVNRSRRSTPAFELLRAGSGVSHVHTNLDELFASEMVGNWWALRGDGTTAGPLALSAVGSPVAQTDRVCPNGPDCAAVESRRTERGSSYFSGAGAAPSGDFACGILVNFDRTDIGQRFLARDDGVNRSFGILMNASVNVLAYVYKAGGSSTTAGGASALPAPGEWRFFGIDYDYVTDGTSVLRLYVNGAESAISSTAVGPVNPVAVAYSVMAGATGADGASGRVAAAFCTEKSLSSTTWAAMSSAVLPQVQGSRGESITSARATVRSCCSGASCALLPANRPCVQGAAMGVSSQTQNLIPQSAAFDATGWTAARSSVLPNVAVGPFGTKTADKLVEDSTASASHEINHAAIMLSAQPYTYSLYAKAAERSWIAFGIQSQYTWFDVLNGAVGTSAVGNTATITALADGWYRCTVTRTAVAANNFGLIRVASGDNVSSYSGDGSSGVYLEDAQLVPGTVAAPYCPTTTSSAVCAADAVTVPTPASLSRTEGCARFCFTPSWSSFNPSGAATVFLYGNGAGTARIAYSNVNDQNLNVYDGTNIASVAAGFSAGVRRCYVTRWSAARNKLRVENESSGASGESAAFTTLGALDPTIMVGSYVSGGAASSVSNGQIDDVSFGTSWESCR